MKTHSGRGKTTCKTTPATKGLVVVVIAGVVIYVRYFIMSETPIDNIPDINVDEMTSQQGSTKSPVYNKRGSTTPVYNKSHHYICPIFDGGIGNQMFQFASSFGIARYKNMEVLIHDQCALMALFKLDVVILKDISVCSGFQTLREINNAVYDRRMIDFDSNTNVRLTIYLQAYRYFDDYKSDLRRQLTFRDEIQVKADKLMTDILQRNNALCKTSNTNFSQEKEIGIPRRCYKQGVTEAVTFVGVHVRRGDWLLPPHPGLGFQTASGEYLHKAVEWYQNRYRNIIFIVASNGMAWAKQNMPANISVEYLEGNSVGVDMSVLALCDHFIATTGTFGWWTGWLTGGNVTYFKWPARENTDFRRSFGKDYTDHFYPSWVGL